MRIKKLMQGPSTPALKRSITYDEEEEPVVQLKRKVASSGLEDNRTMSVGTSGAQAEISAGQKGIRMTSAGTSGAGAEILAGQKDNRTTSAGTSGAGAEISTGQDTASNPECNSTITTSMVPPLLMPGAQVKEMDKGKSVYIEGQSEKAGDPMAIDI